MEQLKPPILIVGAMRSGKSTLACTLAELPGLCVWDEPNALWSTGQTLRRVDIADAADAKPWVIRHMNRMALRYQQSHNGARIIMDGPLATFKIPFLRAVFPGVKVIHLYRDGREVARERLTFFRIHRTYPSIELERSRFWARLQLTHWRDAFAVPMKLCSSLNRRFRAERHWWGYRYLGWQNDRRNLNTGQIAGKEWVMAVETALPVMAALPPDVGLTVRSEALRDDLSGELARIARFCQVDFDARALGHMEAAFRSRLLAHVVDPTDPPGYTDALEVMLPLLRRLGYVNGSSAAPVIEHSGVTVTSVD